MIKKVFILSLSLLFCLSLFSCKKNDSSKKVLEPFTQESIIGYSFINPTDISIKGCCDLDSENINYSSFDVDIPKGQPVKIIVCYDEDLTVETKIKGKKKTFYCKIEDFKYPGDMIARLIPLAFDNTIWAFNMVYNTPDQMPVEDLNLIFSVLINLDNGDWLKSYDSDNSKHRKIVDLCQHLISTFSFDSTDAETTPFHILAAKACYELCDALSLQSFSNIQNKYKQTPAISAILSENTDCLRFFNQYKCISMEPDSFDKTPADYATQSSNPEIQKLFKVFEYSSEQLLQIYTPIAEEVQYSENFKTIGYNAFDIPYTIYNRIQTNGLDVKAETRDQFFTEFAIQQEMSQDNNDGNDNSDETPDLTNKQIVNFAFVYSSDENGMPDYSTRLKLRNSPSSTAKEITTLNYGTKLKILEQSEEPDVIGNISDYWYKVSDGTKEGWCFGGFLTIPVLKTNACCYDKDSEWLIQEELSPNGLYTACEENTIYGSDNQTFDVKPLDKIEIIGCFEYPEYRENIDISNYFISYCNAKEENKSNYHSIYPFYIVRDSKNNTGIMSGKGLTKHANKSSIDYKYYYILKIDILYGNHFYCDVYEQSPQSKDMTKLVFGKRENSIFVQDEFELGYFSQSERYRYNLIPYLSYCYDLSNIKSNLKSKGRIVFFSNDSCDDWGQSTRYSVYTIDEYGYATFGSNFYIRPNSKERNSEFLAGLYPYINENNRLIVFEFYGSRTYYDSGECRETCYETTNIYNGPSFEIIDSKETQHIPEI